MGWKEGALRAECRVPADGFSSKFRAGTRVLLFYPFQFRPLPSDATVLRHGEPCTVYNVINTRLPLLLWLSFCLSVCLLVSEPAVFRSPSWIYPSQLWASLLCAPRGWGSAAALWRPFHLCVRQGEPSEVTEHLDSGFRSHFSNLARPGRICQMSSPKSEMQEPVLLIEWTHSQ